MYLYASLWGLDKQFQQGNLRGNSVAEAILGHVRTKVFVPPDFFIAKPANNRELPFPSFPCEKHT